MIVTDDNFLLFAAKHYESRLAANKAEFEEDLARISYIKRALTNYKNSGELKTRLILNHVTILYNVFGAAATPILFCRMKECHDMIAPFIDFLSFLPKTVCYNDTIINTDGLHQDQTIINRLRELIND